MRIITLLLFCLGSLALNAQVKHSVSLGGTSFSPSTLTIDIGDTVEWTNGATAHNVNGTTTSYPSNPESFGNAVAPSWTFSHVFNTAGAYTYQCDVHVGFGMVAQITVQPGGPTGIEQPTDSRISVFPNPSLGLLRIENTSDLESITIYDINGKLVQSEDHPNTILDITSLPEGVYMIVLKSARSALQLLKIVKI